MARPRSNQNSGKAELSKAVRELRERVGLSQQAFSNALGVALNTIARYETSREPSGEALVQLSRLAFELGHLDLHYFFYTRYVDDVLQGCPIPMPTIPATDTEPSRGYLLLKLSGDHELGYAELFQTLFLASRLGPTDKGGKRVRDLLAQLNKVMVEEKFDLLRQLDKAFVDEGLTPLGTRMLQYIPQISKKPSTAKVKKEKK